MIIHQNRVRNIAAHLGSLPQGQRIRLVVDATPARLARTGFVGAPNAGESLLPAIVGPITRFNSNGRYIVHRNQPKESRYITTVQWTWQQWHGPGQKETVTDYRAIYRDCYPREFVDAPEIEIIYAIGANQQPMLVSPELVWSSTSHEEVQHALNVVLELYGTCEVRTQDLASISPPRIHRVNWTMLPAGQYPWPVVQAHVNALVGSRNARYSGPILHRHAVISAKQPPEVYVGAGGFREYVAFVFPALNLAILESTRGGNATYIFGNNWQTVSQLTKTQVLNGGLHRDRLIHDGAWTQRINQLFS